MGTIQGQDAYSSATPTGQDRIDRLRRSNGGRQAGHPGKARWQRPTASRRPTRRSSFRLNARRRL